MQEATFLGETSVVSDKPIPLLPLQAEAPNEKLGPAAGFEEHPNLKRDST